MKIDGIDFNVKVAKATPKDEWVAKVSHIFKENEREGKKAYLSDCYDKCLKEYDRLNPPKTSAVQKPKND